MTDFLNTLIQRELGKTDNPITPRLGSRYEPVEHKTPFAAFDEKQPLEADGEAGAADEYGYSARQPATAMDVRSAPAYRFALGTPPADQVIPGGDAENPLPAEAARWAPERINTITTESWAPEPVRPSASSEGAMKHYEHGQHQEKASHIEAEPRPVAEESSQNPQDQEKTVDARSVTPPITSFSKDFTSSNSHDEADISGSVQSQHKTLSSRVSQPTAEPLAKPLSEPVTEEESERGAFHPRATSHLTATKTTKHTEETTVKNTQQVVPDVPPAGDRKKHAVDHVEPLAKPAPGLQVGLPNQEDQHSAVPQPQVGNNMGNMGDSRHENRNSALQSASRELAIPTVTVRRGNDSPFAPSSPRLANMSRNAETSAPVATPSQPTINVTIGRIEVRAVTPPAAAKNNRPGPKPMSLNEYLSERSPHGRRRGSQ